MILRFMNNPKTICFLLFVVIALVLSPWIFRCFPQVGEISLWPPSIKLRPPELKESNKKVVAPKVVREFQALSIGKDSVVMGNVSGKIGDRSVVVGATDSHGNTILNKPMAVGHNAHAGPNSIAIGADAGSNSQ
jgi:hypothetical protein